MSLTPLVPPPNDFAWDEKLTWKKLKDWFYRVRAITNVFAAYTSGTATLAAATSAVVSIPQQADTAYRVVLGAQANKTFWVSTKTTTSFTINASSTSSDTVEWLLLR